MQNREHAPAHRIQRRHTSSIGLGTAVLLQAAAAAALLPRPAWSQAGPGGAPRLADVVILGSRLPATASGLAQNVTIIDRKDIEEAFPSRLEDIVARAGGVYVDQAGVGGFSSMYIRGADPSHVLILLDGVKVNDPTTTRGSAFDLSSIDIEQVERIEILRGPASAIYGGEALAGVVNVITRRTGAGGVGGTAYAGAGGHGERTVGGAVRARGDRMHAQLGAGRHRHGGGDGSQTVDTVAASVRMLAGADTEGELFLRRAQRRSDAFPDDSGGPRLAVNREKTHRDATDTVRGLTLAHGDPASLRLQAGATVYDRREASANPFIDAGVRFPVPAFSNESWFRRTTYQATASRSWPGTASVVAGVERQRESGRLMSHFDFDGDGVNETPLPFELARDTRSAFAEGIFTVATDVSVQVGVRRDLVDGLRGETTPHLGAVWQLPGGATALKANYNKGFKPPSFFALGFPVGANPDLLPERSRNAELTLEHRLGERSPFLRVSGFRIEYRDLVDFDPATFGYVNRSRIVVKGIEPAVTYRLGERLRAQAVLTLLDIEEKDTLAPLRNRPEKMASAQVTYDLDPRVSLFAGFASSGGFVDRSNPTGDVRLGGFTTFDVAATVRFAAGRLKLAIDNVFDRQYERFVGFPAAGRRIRVQLRADL